MRKEHQDVLNRLYAIANDGAGTLSVKLKAVELIGKAYGMWEEKIPDPRDNLTAKELEENLKADLQRWLSDIAEGKETDGIIGSEERWQKENGKWDEPDEDEEFFRITTVGNKGKVEH